MPKKDIENAGENIVGSVIIESASVFEKILELFGESIFNLKKPKSLLIQFSPERKYVRRTAEEFRAGAEPVRAGGSSHRMVRTTVHLTPEIKAGVAALSDNYGLDQMKVIRAALRYALKNIDDFDPQAALDDDFEISIDLATPDL